MDDLNRKARRALAKRTGTQKTSPCEHQASRPFDVTRVWAPLPGFSRLGAPYWYEEPNGDLRRLTAVEHAIFDRWYMSRLQKGGSE